jgi:FixJ family two-component response regulator
MALSSAHSVQPRSLTVANLEPRVFVVDDDVSVRESIGALIRTAGWQTETFDCAQKFLAHTRPIAPSCLILDVSLPDLNGLDLQKHISGEGASLPIIFITGHGDVPMTVQAMKAGAVEFLTKPFKHDVLLDAIQTALKSSEAALGKDASLGALRKKYVSMSPREVEVMRLVVRGLLNKQVGDDLGISEITVKAHRGNAMRKMDAGSLPDLVNMAARLGIVPSEDGKASHRNRYRSRLL